MGLYRTSHARTGDRHPGASRAEIATEELSQWFSAHAATIFVCATSIDDLGRAFHEHGAKADRIVIGGGDGTISAALPALLRLGKPLAVLPLGTANDFARTLGVPAEAMEAAEIAIGGCEHCIDVGRVNGRPFINVASVGLAAKVTEEQSRRVKAAVARPQLPHQSLAGGVGGRPFDLEVELDGAPAWSGAVSRIEFVPRWICSHQVHPAVRSPGR